MAIESLDEDPKAGSRFRFLAVIVLVSLVASTSRANAQFELDVQHAFPAARAVSPHGELTCAPDGTVYGVAGTTLTESVFKITPNGEVLTVRTFSAETDGFQLNAPLVLAPSGSIYGAAQSGGPAGGGTIFRLDPATGLLTRMAAFVPGAASAGYAPNALLLASDGNFYGTTSAGGANGAGVAFRMTPLGVVTVLHAFDLATEGRPASILVESAGGDMFGTTSSDNGPVPGVSTVFKMTPAGAVSVLHVLDGFGPTALTRASDGNLYGATRSGGTDLHGTIFRVTDTGVYTLLYEFAQSPDGSFPTDRPIQAADGNLYGTTTMGGPSGAGTLYTISLTGTYSQLHAFDAATEGKHPSGALVQAADGALYGAARDGGPYLQGTVFRATSAGMMSAVYPFLVSPEGIEPRAGLLRASDGNLYGTTFQGGTFGLGTVFKMTSSGAFTTLASFNEANLGVFPMAPLVQASDGNLYGTTIGRAGDPLFGYPGAVPATIFKVSPAGAVTRLVAFSVSELIGPVSAVVEASDGFLYGTTRGTYLSTRTTFGRIFRVSLAGDLTFLFDFAGSDLGSWPEGALVRATDGDLYGTTSSFFLRPGAGVFKVRLLPRGSYSTFKIHTFNLDVDGDFPAAGLVQATDGDFYGTTRGDSARPGTVFRMRADGSTSVLHAFTGVPDGATPLAALLQGADGAFYGTTQKGGEFDAGTIFRVTAAGDYSVLYSFTGGTDGGQPVGSLIQLPDGRFYGTTSTGGASGAGVVFRLRSVASNGQLTIDGPASGSIQPRFTVSGWAIDLGAPTGTGVNAIHLYATPAGGTHRFLGVASYGGVRNDVGAIFGEEFRNSAYSLEVPYLDPGTYTITAYAFSTVTGSFSIVRSVDVTVARSTVMALDGPADNSTVGQIFTIGGWAIDRAAPAGPGTDAIHVYLYPSAGPPIFLGVADRTDRADVAALFGPQFLQSGYSLTVSGTPLPAGAAQLVVYARSSVSGTFNNAVVVNVTVNATNSNPAMFIDEPANGVVIGNSLTVSGWSIDRGAPAGTGVSAIHAWALPTSGAPGAFLGVASYGLPRPDVGSVFGGQFTNSGYTLIADASGLAPGPYYIVVFSYSTVSNSFSFARFVTGVK
jgi:uncharacterized repeat protein (TIGR03803 family)